MYSCKFTQVIEGICHCGENRWSFDGKIEYVRSCNCTVCRKYGALWLYGYLDQNVKIEGADQAYFLEGVSKGFHFCPRCGCVLFWLANQRDHTENFFEIALNMRLIDNPLLIQSIPVKPYDGLDTSQELPSDNKYVKDLWF
ncbi:MAG: GFA family protein [Bdellovibrionota bacterium]